MVSVIPMLAAAFLGLALPQETILKKENGQLVLKSEDPVYELPLPLGYAPAQVFDPPPRFLRTSGREAWAKLSIQVTKMSGTLPQKPAGITAEDILSLVSPPPDATWTFSKVQWNELDIGVIEYRAVVRDLPVLGLSTILPLTRKALRITVYAPDPLEKEIREDFRQLLASITRMKTTWLTDEVLRKMAAFEKVTFAGFALMALYPVAWVIFFRAQPLAAHWPRTIWLGAIAVLLFIPVNSPGPTTLTSNLIVNAIVPVTYLMLTVRRLKLGVDAD